MTQQIPFNPLTVTDAQMTQTLFRADRWMATMAHEPRGPLCAILMSLDELQSICATQPTAQLTRRFGGSAESTPSIKLK